MFGNSHPGSAVNLLQGDADDPAAVAGPLGLYTEEEKARAFELLDEVRLGGSSRIGVPTSFPAARSSAWESLAPLSRIPRSSCAMSRSPPPDPKSSRMVMEHHAQCSHDRLRRKFFINADA